MKRELAAVPAAPEVGKPTAVDAAPTEVVREYGARVVPAPEHPSITLPNEAQLRQLVEQVYQKFPRLRPKYSKW